MTTGPFAGPLSTNFEMLKKLLIFCNDGYFKFLAQNKLKGVKIHSPDHCFFLGGLSLHLNHLIA